jgi:ABC-2 type transport system ATP-binding protein
MALNLDHVSFAYRSPDGRYDVRALNGVSCTVGAGEILGLLGHNGAGKSTLLALAAGLLRPGDGDVTLDGAPTVSLIGTGRIGLLTQRLKLDVRFTVHETLRTFAMIQKVSDVAPRVAGLIGLLGLEGHLDTWVGTLSTGLRKRVGFAVVLMGRPDCVLLDEPFAGLDPESVDVVSTAIRSEADRGATVVVASHDLPEVEALADRLMILKHGDAIARGTLSELRAEIGGTRRVVIQTARGSFVEDLDPATLAAVLQGLASDGVQLLGLREEAMRLHEVYRRLHRDDDRSDLVRGAA